MKVEPRGQRRGGVVGQVEHRRVDSDAVGETETAGWKSSADKRATMDLQNEGK